MALFPDLGSWLFRSVRRESFAESPVLAIERLTSLARPIGDSDKDVLVGAMLTLGSSLNQALNIVRELLPEDKAGERLGEILCPTLGQLLTSLQSTLSSFEPRDQPTPHPNRNLHRLKHSRSESALRSTIGRPPQTSRPLTPILVKKKSPPQTPQAIQQTTTTYSPARFSSPTKYSPGDRTNTELFPVLAPYAQSHRDSISSKASSNRELAMEIQSELRVQAAIQVAVESLEFAEGQLHMVKAINRLHGGSGCPSISLTVSQVALTVSPIGFEKLQRHFYAGYNNLLLKALQLEQREFGPDLSDSDQPPASKAPLALPQQTRPQRPTTGHRQQPSIHVSFPSTMPTTPSTLPRSNHSSQITNSVPSHPQPLSRRNTIQGIKEEGLLSLSPTRWHSCTHHT